MRTLTDAEKVFIAECAGMVFKIVQAEGKADQVSYELRQNSELERLDRKWVDPAAELADLKRIVKLAGGGDLYIEEYGRTCHCPTSNVVDSRMTRMYMQNEANHSTCCNLLWNAIKPEKA